MNVRERFVAVMNFQQPDRNLLWEFGYWPETLERWYREGLKHRDNQEGIPGSGIREYLVYQDEYGVKKRITKGSSSVPEFIGWQVESRLDFQRLKEERFQVDSDGNLDQLIPLFLEAGLTGVWPIEVQAGNDLLEIRRRYPHLRILGGIDKLQIARGPEATDRELEGKLPSMLAGGGYIPLLDHAAHPEISWTDFCYYRQRLNAMIEEQAGNSK
jgi:hypothetical protein